MFLPLGWVVSGDPWGRRKGGNQSFWALCAAQPTPLAWGHTGLGLRCGPDITGACVPRRLRFWTLEFESKSFLYRQVDSVLGPSWGWEWGLAHCGSLGLGHRCEG